MAASWDPSSCMGSDMVRFRVLMNLPLAYNDSVDCVATNAKCVHCAGGASYSNEYSVPCNAGSLWFFAPLNNTAPTDRRLAAPTPHSSSSAALGDDASALWLHFFFSAGADDDDDAFVRRAAAGAGAGTDAGTE